jgi:hypothetical protein
MALMRLAQVIESRNKWKAVSVKRRLELDSKKRLLKRVTLKNEILKNLLAEAKNEIKNLHNSLNSLPQKTSQKDLKIEVRITCILFFCFGFIPCNAAARVLKLLIDTKRSALNWSPNPSSIVNWIGRAGLGMLNLVTQQSEPWIAIIDTSISFAKAKTLVVLRVPAKHFQMYGRALCVSDVECIGLEIKESWTGENVHKALQMIFGRSGDRCGVNTPTHFAVKAPTGA